MNNIITRLLLIFSALLTASMLDAGQHQKNKELAVAIDKKIYEQIEQLLDAGADVNKQSSSGLSLLHKAVMESDEKLVALLINKGAELEINDERDRTPLHMTRDAAVARILIDAGAFRNVKDNNGDTPLHYAARKKTCHDVCYACRKSHCTDRCS
jgi:ankyrin repeat protein